jgi:hypothetical protein
MERQGRQSPTRRGRELGCLSLVWAWRSWRTPMDLTSFGTAIAHRCGRRRWRLGALTGAVAAITASVV